MSNELRRALASAEQAPILTVEFYHSAIGYMRLVRANSDLAATTEALELVTFSKSGVDLSLPPKTTDGRQDLNITISNASNQVWAYISQITTANRAGTDEPVICKLRAFLLSDLSAPSGPVYEYTVMATSIDTGTAAIRASYAQLGESVFPKNRYFTSIYPGLKYV